MKTNLDLDFKTDKSKEMEGVWHKINEEVRFKLRRMGGKNAHRVKKVTAKHYTPYARLIENDGLPEEKVEEIAARTFVECCLVDWEGLKNDIGEEIKYSESAAVELLTERTDLLSYLTKISTNPDNFREDLGNS